ncbi:MAG TPA: response regulator [Terriglobales bacterium]|nr:response regulator [Terriglobales bacterium]
MKLLGKRLLLVDDERAIRETLSAILRRYGLLVTAAAKISEALDAIAKEDFDLLICDLNIEGESDGYQVIRAMKELNGRCINIILTGNPALGSAIEGIHLGIDDYIMKPAKPDTLIALLAEKLAARERKNNAKSASAENSFA